VKRRDYNALRIAARALIVFSGCSGTVVTMRADVKTLRLAPARRRAAHAKLVLGAGGSVVFGLAMLFARGSYAGHPKRPVRPLTAPPRFVSIVRANLLQAGIVAPAEAPPEATTSGS
jgi:hypothetical protein